MNKIENNYGIVPGSHLTSWNWLEASVLKIEHAQCKLNGRRYVCPRA